MRSQAETRVLLPTRRAMRRPPGLSTDSLSLGLVALLLFGLYRASALAASKPVLVVGATGRVGRLVVQKLLDANVPVRALVRNPDKAQRIFGASYPAIDVVPFDYANGEDANVDKALGAAMQGCSVIISVSGSTRFSKWADFLPWNLFRPSLKPYDGDKNHPYYGNYKMQVLLMDLAIKNNMSRFVRLTGLSLAYPAYHPIVILFNTLLSQSSVYGRACERALYERRDQLPYVVLRPGGLAEDGRDVNTTSLQIDASGKLPLPGRVGRDDVAQLCVESCSVDLGNRSYTLACRWCGDGIKPKPQGSKEDGYATAKECMQQLVGSSDSAADTAVEPAKRKPHALFAGLAVYSIGLLALKVARSLWHLLVKLIGG